MYKRKWCYYTWHIPTGLFLCFKSSFPRKGMQTQNNTKITHVYWQKTYLVKEVWVIRLDVGFRCLFPDKLGASDAPIIPTGVINQIKYVTHNSVNFQSLKTKYLLIQFETLSIFLTYNLLGIYSVIYNNQQVYDVCSGNLAPWPGFHFL